MSKWRDRVMNEVRIGDRVVCVHNPINISCFGELEQRKNSYKERHSSASKFEHSFNPLVALNAFDVAFLFPSLPSNLNLAPHQSWRD